MKKTKLLLGIIPVFLFSSSILVLKAQIPAAIDTKMKSDNMRNFQVEEIKKKRMGIIPKNRFVPFILFSDLFVSNISLKHIHIEEKQI